MYVCRIKNQLDMEQKRNKTVFGVVSGMFFIIATLIICSCQKAEIPQQHLSNRLINYPADGKATNTYLLSIRVGHDGKNCPGCILYKGRFIHRDCIGNGHYCNATARVTLDSVDTDITATTTDTFDLTSEDFFLMPDRSLNYTDENNNRIFLNIPAQMVYRDSVTRQFTFTGLFFSDTAAYSNL